MPTHLQSAPQLRLVHEPDRPVPVERLGDVVGEQQVEETALSLLGEDVLQKIGDRSNINSFRVLKIKEKVKISWNVGY